MESFYSLLYTHLLIYWSLETGSHYIAQTGLEREILLPSPPVAGITVTTPSFTLHAPTVPIRSPKMPWALFDLPFMKVAEKASTIFCGQLKHSAASDLSENRSFFVLLGFFFFFGSTGV
jgi:hypothetical protein